MTQDFHWYGLMEIKENGEPLTYEIWRDGLSQLQVTELGPKELGNWNVALDSIQSRGEVIGLIAIHSKLNPREVHNAINECGDFRLLINSLGIEKSEIIYKK